MAGRWVYPIDPDCPEVAEFYEGLYGDPMTAAMGAPVGDISQGFDNSHRAGCERCQEYGVENVDVEY
jgi:hypothetical protein